MATFIVSNPEVQLSFTLDDLHKDVEEEAKELYGGVANALIEIFSLSIIKPGMLPLAQRGIFALRDMMREEGRS